METEIKEASFVVKSEARAITIDTSFDDSLAKNTMKLLLDDHSEMSFSFRTIPRYGELARRYFPYTCIRRPIKVSVEFPLITEAELQMEVERKQKIADLKADIKSMESRLKCLEAVDNIGKRYGY